MKERNSTFELLRIIAITFIMIHHVIVFGLGGCNYELNVEHCDTNPWINDIINSLCIIGVNLFILITGWFGVKQYQGVYLDYYQYIYVSSFLL